MRAARTNHRSKPAQTAPDLRQRAQTLRSCLSATPSAGPPPQPFPFAATVEAELVALNERYEAVQRAYEAAHTHDMEIAANNDPALKNALEYASVHSLRLRRIVMREAMGLPAASILSLGLQARLIAHEASDWWEDEHVDHHHELCRMLLDRLMGLAGVSRIHGPDLSADDLLGWIAEPSTAPGASDHCEGGKR